MMAFLKHFYDLLIRENFDRKFCDIKFMKNIKSIVSRGVMVD